MSLSGLVVYVSKNVYLHPISITICQDSLKFRILRKWRTNNNIKNKNKMKRMYGYGNSTSKWSQRQISLYKFKLVNPHAIRPLWNERMKDWIALIIMANCRNSRDLTCFNKKLEKSISTIGHKLIICSLIWKNLIYEQNVKIIIMKQIKNVDNEKIC